MRLSLLVLGLCACSKAPTKPDPAALKQLSYEAQCEAVAPRVAPCANEMMIADLRAIAGPGEMDRAETQAISDELRREEPSADAARKMAILSCMGTRNETFPSQVLACWEVDDCKRFAECMTPP